MGENQSMSEQQPDLILHPKDFPAFLKGRMSAEGLSASQMATKLGVGIKLVYALLYGQRTPSDAILKKLSGEVYYGFTAPKAKK